MSKKRGLVCLVSIFALIFSVSLVSAQTEGIPLQKDVILGVPIYGPEDLPEEITFTLYDAQNGLTPLGAQTFMRGQYTVDFEFSQSDGVTGGSVARVKADFTQPLNLKDPSGQTLKPKELWAALEVAGAEVGARTKVSDETLVRLLLNSDASLATYLTLAYEGDDNPLTTIYKSLPLSSVSSDGSTTSLSNYFSSLPESRDFGDTTRWNDSGASDVYTMGKVGIGTSTPADVLDLNNVFRFSGTQGEMASIGNLNINIDSDNNSTTSAFRIGKNARYGAGGTPTILVSVLESGRVGIGTATPADVLDLNNVFRFSGTQGEMASTGNLNINIDSDNNTSNGVFRVGKDARYGDGGTPTVLFTIVESGNVGIGTTNTGTYKLAVEGNIGCRELTVTTAAWADFVFEDNYRLPPLNEVEQFISENKHLPGIPTEAEVNENGVSVGNISSKLLQKIEELTLYVIDMKKENDALKVQMANMEAQLKAIKN